MTERSPATRWTIWLSLAAVSSTAAVASYLHALTVVQAADGHTAVSFFVAALADPAIFAASVNILDASRRGTGLPRWSMASVAVAVVVTLSANIAAGSPHSVPAWLVNVWPPVAFLMALESLMSYIRRGHAKKNKTLISPAAAAAGQSPRDWLDTQLREMAGRESERKVAEAFGVSRPRVAAAVAGLNGSAPDG